MSTKNTEQRDIKQNDINKFRHEIVPKVYNAGLGLIAVKSSFVSNADVAKKRKHNPSESSAYPSLQSNAKRHNQNI